MSRLRRCCAVVLGWTLGLAAARGQVALPSPEAVHSVSGQFIVSRLPDRSPFPRNPAILANTNLVHLDPAFLAVAAERFKILLWRQLELSPSSSWSGKIFLLVRPAHATNESVTISSGQFVKRWDYDVELPDVMGGPRYARALSAVLLLEIANRSAGPGGHSAELPPWLVDGMAQQILGVDSETVLLSVPVKKSHDLSWHQAPHEFDTLTAARKVLQNTPALTFDQLSWPTDEQMNGLDGGVYLASAQLFLSQLLSLKDGPEKMRAFLAELPAHLNWQIAFYGAFHDDFQRPLDVEKWWSLRVVNFVAHSPGPRWTSDVSRDRLAALLSVPVEFRADSNAFPSHAEISLQSAIRSLDPVQRENVLRIKVRDLALVELRLAPPFGQLADGYRLALTDFLGELKKPRSNKHGVPNPKPSIAGTVSKLDALDLRRREAESRLAVLGPGTGRPSGSK